ncbi:serine hydrolase domain-containing protein [Flavitalea antarctica]
MKITFALIILSFFVESTLWSQAPAKLSNVQIKKLDSIALQDVPPGAPGIATAIIQNGKIIYQKTAGLTNLTNKTPVTARSRFNIASNGKQFTALAILELIEEKKLGLEDDIRTYLPGLYPALGDTISIGHLLTHTSGIRDVYDLLALQGITWWKTSMSNQQIVDMLKRQEDLNFKPGSKYLYSNSNYILLAEIIGKIRGMHFNDYCKLMFKRLGMASTSFEANHAAIPGEIALPYFNFNTWTTYEWLWDAYGDGNLFTTLEDQVIWEQSIQRMRNRGLKSAVIKQSQLPVSDVSAAYGFGLEFGQYYDQPYTFHEGATGAWKATVLRFPGYNLSMLTFTNSGKAIPSMQTRQMADVVLNLNQHSQKKVLTPELPGPWVTPKDLEGIYQTEAGFTFRLQVRDTALFLMRSGRNDIRLVREAANIFHQWNDSTFKQEFIKNAAGQMELTVYHTSHSPYTLLRLETNWDSFDLTMPNGEYKNVETNVSLSIRNISGLEYEVDINGAKRQGLLITRERMLVDNYQIEFGTTEGTSITSLKLNGERIKNVLFIKKK